jgi:HEAT repeat protein
VLKVKGGQAAAAITQDLRWAAHSVDPRMRWGATFALFHVGIREPEMVPPLVEALDVPDPDQRWGAALALVECGRALPGEVVPSLLDVLATASSDVRKMVMYVLRDLAPGTPEVTEALVRSMRDPDVGVRMATLSALSRLEPPPENACDLVLQMLREDPDAGLRRAATSALGRVGARRAGGGGGAVGAAAATVRAVLAEAAASDDPALRRAAEFALRRL